MSESEDRFTSAPRPPWELPGGFRRDAEPHRGFLLRVLANAGLVCSLVAFAPCACPLALLAVPIWAAPVLVLSPSLLGTVLGLIASLLAERDLGAMRVGIMDPEGRWEATFAHERGGQACGLGLAALVLWSWLLLACWYVGL